MIRRELNGEGIWCLIRQMDHARFAAQIADCWAELNPLDEAGDRADFTSAVRVHDDGWETWDQEIHLSTSGVPIAFNELPYGEDNRIWSASIRAAEEEGPLPAYLVARHFLRLRPVDPSSDPEGHNAAFASQFESECERWLREWSRGDRPDDAARHTAEKAVDGLQFFDFLSLLICLGRGDPAKTLKAPDGETVVLRQQAVWEFELSGPNLGNHRLEFRLPIWRLAVGNYEGDKSVKQASKLQEVSLQLVSA